MPTVIREEILVQNGTKPPRKPKKPRGVLILMLLAPLFAGLVIAGVWVMTHLFPADTQVVTGEEGRKGYVSGGVVGQPLPDWIQVDLIPVDGTSRRGVKLEALNGIVVHYVGNPGTTALQNRNYYANPASEVSSHFLIDLDGSVIQCVPLDEKASASNERNADTLSIEVCHPDETGKFTPESEETLVRLLALLCKRYSLSTDSIIRHYDVTGKSCPKYYVEHEDAFEALKNKVEQALEAAK